MFILIIINCTPMYDTNYTLVDLKPYKSYKDFTFTATAVLDKV